MGLLRKDGAGRACFNMLPQFPSVYLFVVCSSFDEYAAEVRSGRLEWSPVHRSDKFWVRQNYSKHVKSECMHFWKTDSTTQVCLYCCLSVLWPSYLRSVQCSDVCIISVFVCDLRVCLCVISECVCV